MDQDRYYQIADGDFVSPLLRHRYLKLTQARPYRGVLRGEFMCWSRSMSIQIRPDSFAVVGNPEREAALRYLHIEASQRDTMPAPFTGVYTAGKALRKAILDFGTELNAQGLQRRTVYFLSTNDLTQHLDELQMSMDAQARVLYFWKQAIFRADQLTLEEEMLFAK